MVFSINNTRKSIVKEVIEEKYKGILTDEDLKTYINKAMVYVNGANTITSNRVQEDNINGEEIDLTLKELYVDILTAFRAVNEIDDYSTTVLENSKSNINKILGDIEKANSILEQYELYMKCKGNPAYIIDEFKNKNNFETNLKYYEERYGESIGSFTASVYDEESCTLILPKLRTSNMACYSKDVRVANVSLTRQYCSSYSQAKDKEKINNVIVPNSEDVWGETILVDEPIRIIEENEHYSITNGALFELEIDFNASTVINEITIVPFSKYPVDLLTIKYSITGSDDEEPTYLVSNKAEDEALKPISLIDTVTYRFANTTVKKIYITMNQLHYTRESFIYNTTDKLLNDVVHSIKNGFDINSTVNEDIIFKPVVKENEELNPALSLINDMLTSNKKLNVNEVLFSNEGEDKNTIKYVYNYGVNSIIPRNNEFDRCGVFVSKPITNMGGIKSVKIITDESHPKNRNGDIVTDIEYYITSSINPTWSDWIPILPSNKQKIEIELLQMYNDLCYLRFTAERVEGVWSDGISLNEDIDYFIKRKNGAIYAIEIPDFDPMSCYTVKYVPKVADALDLSSMAYNNVTEEFDGNNKSMFELSNNINVSDSDIYIKIVNTDTGKVIAKGNDLICVTDNYESYDSYKNFNSSLSNYQYYTNGRYLYFNKAISSNYKIDISYKYCVNQIRLKAILRRNSKYDKHITPSINSIKYEIVSME